jgi:hypothetical protein
MNSSKIRENHCNRNDEYIELESESDLEEHEELFSFGLPFIRF